MFQSGAAAGASTKNSAEREQALTALGQAVALRPWNFNKIQTACQAIRDAVVAGEEDGDSVSLADGLILEACLTAANFETMTKLVDGTLRKPLSSRMTTTMGVILTVGRTVRNMLPRFLTGS